MSKLLPQLIAHYGDANGIPLAGGKLYSYIAGTTTPVATFADQSEVTPNTNPVVLDASGNAKVWIGDGFYKFVLTDSSGNIQFTEDNVSVSNDGSQSLWATHAIADGQPATALAGETVNFALYKSAIYDVTISRGTTVTSTGPLWIDNVNGTGRARIGIFSAAHGVTFTVSMASLVATILAAADVGAGAGSITMSRRLVPA